MVSAGEASGDMHAALALQALREMQIEFSSFGLGGNKLQAEGMELLLHCKELSVIGIFEVLIQYHQLLKKLNFLRKNLLERKPDLLIIVDYPDFNLKLAETAKKVGIPVLFYISPQVWAWREKRVNRIGSLVSMMAVIFPFEVPFYEKANVPVNYVGHPLVDEAYSRLDTAAARDDFDVGNGRPVLAILPGSRNGEVKRILPTMLATLDELLTHQPNLDVLLPQAATLESKLLEELLVEHKLKIKVIKGRSYEIMQAADVVMTASGTATLETALIGTPMVIVYKVNPVSYAIMSRMIRIENIGLVNIVAGKRIVQEFVQNNTSPKNISKELKRLLTDKRYAQQMRDNLKVVKDKMGDGGASNNVAKLIQRMLEQDQPVISC